MPVYTYRCEECGVQFEVSQRFSDEPLTRCPECGESSLRKVYTPVGIVFKGSGFYATDNRSPSGMGRSSTHSEEKSAATDTAKSTDTNKSTETTTKPAAESSASSD